MNKTTYTLDGIISALNEFAQTDNDAIYNLINLRADCNEQLANHPTVQVGKFGDVYKVGLLGILNGFLGKDENGYGAVIANFDENNNVYFSKNENFK